MVSKSKERFIFKGFGISSHLCRADWCFKFDLFHSKTNLKRKRKSFCGALIPLFWTCGDVSPGCQNQSGQPYSSLGDSLRFTSYVTLLKPWPGSQVILFHLIYIWVNFLLSFRYILFQNFFVQFRPNEGGILGNLS